MINTPKEWLMLIENPCFLAYTYQKPATGIEKLALYLQKHYPSWPRAVITAQIKNIQKARQKLPSWVEAQCIFPTQAYEQATSERAAAFKRNYHGRILLDLGLGLGVDSWNFSYHFEEVWSIEKDSVLCQIGQYNLGHQLQRENIKIREGFIPSLLNSIVSHNPNIDLAYLDPARRSETKAKLTAIASLEPNILELLPLLRPKVPQIVIKLSPLFDLQEGLRIFGKNNITKIQIIAIDGECKEMVFEINGWLSGTSPLAPLIEACIDQNQNIQIIGCPLPQLQELSLSFASEGFFAYEADVSIYKGGLEAFLFDKFREQGALGWTSKGGYLLASGPLPNFPGKGYIITEGPFIYSKYRALRILQQRKIKHATLTKKNFDISIAQLYTELQLKPGEDTTLLFSKNPKREGIFFIGRRISEK